jgi:hypothetical protein
MCLSMVSGSGLANMTYSTDGGGEQTLSGPALTDVWYQGEGNPVVGYLQLNFGDVNLSFGINPFSGTGSYSSLPYLAFTEAWVLSPTCHGLWTTGDDPPDLDVTTFSVAGAATAWAMTLTATLAWWVEDCQQPPVTLGVSSLTMTTREVPSAAATPPADFDEVARQKAIDVARRIGVSSFPA